ncbi:GGDEF domain-containing protein [Candidatus Saccharibacteria bacterium]|nr:GGDEF domain-containing protein [Candidatus Saccharibacteria bacterium]
MIEYCVLAGISVFFLLMCLMYLKDNDIFGEEMAVKFQKLIMVLMAEIVVDTLFMLLEGKEIARWILYTFKAGEFVMNPIVAFLVFDVFYNEKLKIENGITERLWKGLGLIAIFNVPLQIFGMVTGKIFFLDEWNFYHRGEWIWAYLAVLVVAIVLVVIETAIFSNQTQGLMKRMLLAFPSILVLGLILREFFPRRNYDFLCMATSVIFLLVYYSNVILRIDPLTQLLNRLVYASAIRKVDYATVVIMIDVNKFKEINDSYGHRYGDKVLRQVARFIREAYGKEAYCFRIGGDEFFAFLKRGEFEKLAEGAPGDDDIEIARAFARRLDTVIQEQIADATERTKNCLKNGVAWGCAVFYPQDFSDGSEGPLKSVIQVADEEMYRRKREMTSSSAEVI